MNLWIDADSCPPSIRTIIMRAARRLAIDAIFVANRTLPSVSNNASHTNHEDMAHGTEQRRDHVTMVVTEDADRYIILHAQAGDVLVSRDLALADTLLTKGVTVIDRNGQCYTKEIISSRLRVRTLQPSSSPIHRTTQHPHRNKQRFAATLERVLRHTEQ